MITKEQVIQRIEAQIAVCSAVDSDWITLTVGTAKRILELIGGNREILCKDCRHYIAPTDHEPKGHCDRNPYYWRMVDADWYCAERKVKK